MRIQTEVPIRRVLGPSVGARSQWTCGGEAPASHSAMCLVIPAVRPRPPNSGRFKFVAGPGRDLPGANGPFVPQCLPWPRPIQVQWALVWRSTGMGMCDGEPRFWPLSPRPQLRTPRSLTRSGLSERSECCQKWLGDAADLEHPLVDPDHRPSHEDILKTTCARTRTKSLDTG